MIVKIGNFSYLFILYDDANVTAKAIINGHNIAKECSVNIFTNPYIKRPNNHSWEIQGRLFSRPYHEYIGICGTALFCQAHSPAA